MTSRIGTHYAQRLLARRRLSRSLLGVAYLLASMLAMVAHQHGEDLRRAPHAVVGCSEAQGVHLAHHPDAPDLSHHPELCAACEYRSQHHATACRAAEHPPVVTESHRLVVDPLAARRFVVRTTTRAPPLV